MDLNGAIKGKLYSWEKMTDSRLAELLGNNYELLDKSPYYLTTEEKWRVLQALLYQFGAEFENENILLFANKEKEFYIESLRKAVNNFMKTKKNYNEKEEYWELSLK